MEIHEQVDIGNGWTATLYCSGYGHWLEYLNIDTDGAEDSEYLENDSHSVMRA